MLDHLDTLDDTTPPTADDAMLTEVRGRADRMRRRSRLAGAGASVVVLAVALGAVAVVNDRDRAVTVVGPTATTVPATIPIPPRRSAGTLPNGLHIEMTVEKHTVVVGSPVEVGVEVRNDTGAQRIIGVGSARCALQVQAVLRDSEGHHFSDPTPGCDEPAQTILPGGSVAFDESVPTDLVLLPTGKDRGQYELSLEASTGGPTPKWRLAPVAVEVAVPRVTGRIEIPTFEFAADSDARGVLVLNNLSAEPVAYRSGCFHGNAWQVILGNSEAGFSSPMPQGPCASEPRLLPPGISRFPFQVPLRNPGCSAQAVPLANIPQCVNGIPPLEPGAYQLFFKGWGAFNYLDGTVAPVSITIHGVN